MNWKSIPLWLLTAFLIYSCIKTPTYTDAIIAIVLGSLYGLENYLNWRTTPITQDDELSKMRKALELEKMQFEKERITRARVTETDNNSGAGLKNMIKF